MWEAGWRQYFSPVMNSKISTFGPLELQYFSCKALLLGTTLVAGEEGQEEKVGTNQPQPL